MRIGGRLWIAFWIALILATAVSAATIKGTVYNLELDPVSNAIVEINTDPKQTYVAKDGTYSFHVPAGSYTIAAKIVQVRETTEEVEENLTVSQEGIYVLDLILLPVVELGELELDETDIGVEEALFEKEGPPTIKTILIGAGIILIAIGAFFLIRRGGRKKAEESGDEEEEKIFGIIKKNKRITQKELRKYSPLSEGKISLIIADLENKGKVRKIKKGRGNIILLK